MNGWRAALRIARREALRAKGRSLLVIAMIALPILAMSLGLTVYYSFEKPSPETRATREFGAADAMVEARLHQKVMQQPDDLNAIPVDSDEGAIDQKWTTDELLKALPAGSKVLPFRDGRATVRTKTGIRNIQASELDYADPMARGMLTIVSGRFARTDTEIALSARLAKYLGIVPGQQVTFSKPAKTYTVTGIVENPNWIDSETAYSPADLIDTSSDDNVYTSRWLVDTPEPITWSAVLGLNDKGIGVLSRHVLANPPARADVPYYMEFDNETAETQVIAGATLVAGLAVLEIVLLAGPAFAVGARRQKRDLALIIATGGAPKHVRAVVLSGGIVLGLVAGVTGTAIGVLGGILLRPVLEPLIGKRSGPPVVPVWLVAAIVGIAVVIGLLAAMVPAWSAARQDPVAALAGRRGTGRSKRRYVVAGIAMTAMGGAIGVLGAFSTQTIVILAGVIIGELGLVLCTPAIVGAVARLGARLPLGPRIALRDASRNRASAAPAVAAVMAAVAGTVAIGLYIASENEAARAGYVPSLRYGQVAVNFQGGDDGPTPDTISDIMRRTLPVDKIYPVTAVGMRCPDGNCQNVSLEVPPASQCPLWNSSGEPTREQREQYASDPRCQEQSATANLGLAFVDDGTVLPTLLDVSESEAARAIAALKSGKVVIYDPLYIVDGKVTLAVSTFDGSKSNVSAEPIRRTFPAYVVKTKFQSGSLIMPPSVATSLGVTSEVTGMLATTTRMPTSAEQDAANAAVEGFGFAWVSVERGYVDNFQIGLIALAIAGGLITLGASAVATGLAAADGRADLTTLAAVGAAPRVRRVLALSQSGVIAGLGTVLGVIAGFISGSTIILAQRRQEELQFLANVRPFVVPWPTLLITIVVVPLVAMLGAGLLTRSRLPIERRLS